jgi:probable DNA repair protein
LTAYRQSFERAVAAAAAGSTVLTANTRSARAIHAAVGERLRTQSDAWLSPDVLPFGAFVERLFSDAVVTGAVNLQALQREQELQLWRQIIERSPTGRQMLLPDSAAALAAEAFRTAIEHGIALDSPQMSASSDTRAFSGWAAEFQRQLAAHRWTCPALFTRELASCLSSGPHGSLRIMSLPEQLFTFLPDATPAQRRFLDALAASGIQVTAAPQYSLPLPESLPFADAAAPTPVRYEFDGVGDELGAAAQWARRQLMAAPEARIGVIFFDLDRKLPQVKSAFRSVLHPEQLLGQRTSTAFEIASPVPLAGYPVVRCALQLLSLFAAPIGFHEFHAMLSSPYFAAAPESVARFVAEVRKNARRQVSLHDFARWLTESKELPALRAAFESLPKHAQFSSEQPVAYWADVSRQILRAFGWPAGVPLGSEEFQCTESWRDLLAAISALELLEWRTDFRGYVARLERAASSQNFKPETLNAPVQIMDLAESEGSLFDALWIGSSSDDLWPDSPRTTPLIPVALLKEAGAAITGTPQAAARIARITATLLQSAPQIVLSLARYTDDEREQRWSPCLTSIPLSTAPVELPLPLGQQLAQQFEPAHLDELSDFAAPALAPGERVHGGTSLLQDQSNCPFRAFAIRRLLAREPQGPSEPLAPTERGNVFDRALQLIWEELKDSTGLARPDLAAVIATAVDEAMAAELPSASGELSKAANGYANLGASGDASADAWTIRFRLLERQRTIDVLTEWLSLEARRKPFHVLGHQLEVELALGGTTLRGRLDRLDEVGGEHVVIDYKTGASNNVSAWQVPRPRLPQLPFYALAMRQQHFNLAGISFAVLRRGDCTFKGYLRDKEMLPCSDPTRRNFEGLPFDEYSLRWAEELERIATAFAQGDASVDPKIPAGSSGSPCQYCHLASLCRVGDVAIDDSDGESDGVDDE